MSFIEACALMIKIEEGWRSRPYDDSTGRPVRAPIGKITLGYGFNLCDGDLPTEVGDFWLEFNLKRTIKEAESLDVFHQLSDTRKMAVIDMIYNMGLPTIRGFKLFLGALARQDWKGAAREIQDSSYYNQLPIRAQRKCDMILNDENVYL